MSLSGKVIKKSKEMITVKVRISVTLGIREGIVIGRVQERVVTGLVSFFIIIIVL